MQRYKVRCRDCDPEITPHENGKWVKHSDVERFRAELAEAKTAITNARRMLDCGFIEEAYEYLDAAMAGGE